MSKNKKPTKTKENKIDNKPPKAKEEAKLHKRRGLWACCE